MIPLSVPHLAGNEWQYVKDCLDTGWVSSAGAYVTKFEEMVAEQAGRAHGVACMNGTSGLHLVMRILGVGAGDLVIVPNITFIASANAVAYLGAEPLLVDVDVDTWQLDANELERLLRHECERDENGTVRYRATGQRVAALMLVHVLGNLGELDRYQALAAEFDIPIVEDSTEAQGSTWDGQPAGSFSIAGVFSYNGNKIITTGGGGMIVTDDEALARRAKHLSTQAKPDPQEYFHDAIGYNYRLVNVLAALGVAQLEQLPVILARKREIDAYYRRELAGVGDIWFQRVLAKAEPNCWLFTFGTEHMRELLAHLNEHGVQSRPFWVPMNQLPMFEKAPYITRADNANRVFETSISIPCSSGITDAQLQEVVRQIKAFFAAR